MNDTKTVSGNIVHIEDGSEAPVLSLKVAITPKQSGTGTPSPDNVRQISGWESVSVFDTGKNLFDKSAMAKNWYITGSNTIGNGGTCLLFSVPIGSEFTVSGTNGGRNRLLASDKPYNELAVGDALTPLSNTNLPIVSSEIPQYRTYIYYCETSFNQAIADSIQVEIGNTATAYAPYNGHTTTTSLGRTVYGGEAEIVSGSLMSSWNLKTFNGSENWTDYPNESGLIYLSGAFNNVPAEKPSGDYFNPDIRTSNLLKSVRNVLGVSDKGAFSFSTANYGLNIYIRLPDTISDAAAWKTFLATHPFQVCYELATPQTYQLTPTEVKTLLGENNVWADAGAILEMTYRTETLGIFGKIMIDGRPYFRPNNFELKREDVYAAEYTTCTGKTIADKIGWKYSDMTMKWDILTNEMLATLTALAGETALQFRDSDGTHTERIIRRGFSNTPTRTTGPEGTALWTNIEMDVSFINTHTEVEE